MSDIPAVRELCKRLVPGEIPQWVHVQPLPTAEPDDCLANVARLIKQRGGEAEYGWLLWETLPEVMIEAEFHAVWVDEDGLRYDVTPKEMPVTQVVFLPDRTIEYKGRQVDNVRVALKDDPLIEEFIQAAKDYFEVTNRGDLADYHGPIELTDEMKLILARRAQLEEQILGKYYSAWLA